MNSVDFPPVERVEPRGLTCCGGNGAGRRLEPAVVAATEEAGAFAAWDSRVSGLSWNVHGVGVTRASACCIA